MPAPLLIFTHIPKTAGSTMVALLSSVFPAREMAKVTGTTDPAAFMAALPEEVRIIRGHHPYGLHRHTARPCQYFTILRDPVERVISLYYFLLRDKDHPTHAKLASGERTLVDLARTQRDIQTAFIAGADPVGPRNFDSELPAAKEHLQRDFRACGLMEQFDASLLLLQDAFGWDFASYRPRNVTRNRPARETIAAEALRAIEENNQADLELYRYAQAALAEAIARQPADFHDRLRRLQSRVGHLRRLSRIFNGARHWVTDRLGR